MYVWLVTRSVGVLSLQCEGGTVSVSAFVDDDSYSGCLTRVVLTEFETSVCKPDSYVVITNAAIQRAIEIYTLVSSTSRVWVGAFLDAYGVAIDDKENPLPYTNFEEGYPITPYTERACVILNRSWNHKWRNDFCDVADTYGICADSQAGSVGVTTPNPMVSAPVTSHTAVDDSSTKGLTTGTQPVTSDSIQSTSSMFTPEDDLSTDITLTDQSGSPPTTPVNTSTNIATEYSVTVNATEGQPVDCYPSEAETSRNSCTCMPVTYLSDDRRLKEVLLEIRRRLTLNKSSLSSVYRRRHSAVDSRQSSLCMGCVAIVVLASVVVTVLFLDLSHIIFKCSV